MDQDRRKKELNNSHMALQNTATLIAAASGLAVMDLCYRGHTYAATGFAFLFAASLAARQFITNPSATMKPYRDGVVMMLSDLRRSRGLDDNVEFTIDAPELKKMKQYLIEKAHEEFPEDITISTSGWPVIDPISRNPINTSGDDIVVLVPNDEKCTSYQPISLNSVLINLSSTCTVNAYTKEALFTNHLGNRVDLSKTITVSADAFEKHFNPDYSPEGPRL